MIKLIPLVRDVEAIGESDLRYILSKLLPIKTISIDEFSKYYCRPIMIDGQIISAYNFGLGKWCLAEFAT